MGKGNEKWRQLSSTKPGGAIKAIDDKTAEALLEAMVKDSAFQFSRGVEMYVLSERQLKKTRKTLVGLLEDDEEKKDAFYSYEKAIEKKQAAVRAIKNEYLFMNGSRDVRPPIDGTYVMTELIKSVLGNMNEELYNEVIDIIELYRKTNKKRGFTTR